MNTSHIQPTLTDTEVLEFCKNGYLLLDGVVPEEINHKAVAFLDSDTYYEPTDILAEDWFIENVTLNPAAAGAIRSLLGAGFTAPVLMSNHRVHMPQPAQHWHRDGQSRYGPALHYLQVFYYPEACTPEMGPTEVLPGSHYLFQHASFMGHYGNMRHSVKTAASAGSIVLTVYSVWHRRSASSASGIRNLLKYNYWRTSPPVRDWTIEPDFDFALADYTVAVPGPRQQFQECLDAAEMFFWLCGKSGEYRTMGGQGWPLPGNRNAPPAGFPGQPTAVTY